MLRAALVLMALAIAVQLAFTRPTTHAARAANEECARLTAAQVEQGRQLEYAARRERDSQQALRALAAVSSASLPELRSRALARLSGLQVSDVQLDIEAARPPALAEIKLQAQGDFLELVRLTSRLAGPGTGLALKSVTFSRNERDARVKLSLTANDVGAAR